MYKIAVLASTRGTNFQSIIDAVQNGTLKGVEIACLITNNLDSGAITKAEKAGIPQYCIFADSYPERESYDREIDKILKRHKVDLVVLGGWMRILSPWFVREWEHKIINIHPSLLPKFAGGMDLDVHQAVIDAGETETGFTIHFVEEGVDTGKIILQKKVPVLKYDTAKKVKKKVQTLELEWYPKVIQSLANHSE